MWSTSLPDGTHVGLRVYGHREPNTDEERGCQDTELISPVQALDRDALHEAIDGFEPSGFTPIGASLQAAADDLPPEGPRTIILVSDGEDTCAPPDPCQVAAELRGDGVDLVVETVGFALGSDEAAREQLECIAEAGGGQFTDVATAAELVEQLEAVSQARARRTTDTDGTPVEGQAAVPDAPLLDGPGRYTDTIVNGEKLWYGIELEEGQIARLQATILPADDVPSCGPLTQLTWESKWRNPDGQEYNRDYSFECAGLQADTIVNDSGEISGWGDGPTTFHFYLTYASPGTFDPPREFPVQLDLEVVEAAPEEPEEPDEAEEPEEAGEPDEPEDEDDELAAEPAGSEGLPAWAAVLLTLLVVLVLGLGALVVVLFRRTSAPAGSPPSGPPPSGPPPSGSPPPPPPA